MDRPIAYDKLAREERFVRMRAREVAVVAPDVGDAGPVRDERRDRRQARRNPRPDGTCAIATGGHGSIIPRGVRSRARTRSGSRRGVHEG